MRRWSGDRAFELGPVAIHRTTDGSAVARELRPPGATSFCQKLKTSITACARPAYFATGIWCTSYQAQAAEKVHSNARQYARCRMGSVSRNVRTPHFYLRIIHGADFWFDRITGRSLIAMERRAFVALLCAALAMRPTFTNAQQAGRRRTVGVLMGIADDQEAQA